MMTSVFSHECVSQQVLDPIAGKWTAIVLCALDGDARRYAELRRLIEGVSERCSAKRSGSWSGTGSSRVGALAGDSVCVDTAPRIHGEVIGPVLSSTLARLQSMPPLRPNSLSRLPLERVVPSHFLA